MKKLIGIFVSFILLCGASFSVIAEEIDAQESLSAILTSEEEDVLHEQEIYYVGVRNLYSSICSRNSEGELEGLAIDVIGMLEEMGEIEIEYVEVNEESDQSVYDTIDFYFLGPDELEGVEMIESEVYYDIPLLYVEKSFDGDSSIEVGKVGLISYYGLEQSDVIEYIGDKDIVEYSDVKSIQEAYNRDEIDSIVITTASLNMIRSGFEELNFYSTPMELYLELSFAFPSDYSVEKIEIFNKLIEALDETEMEYSLFTHASNNVEEATIFTVISHNPLTLINIAACILIFFLVMGYRGRRELAKKMNYDALTGLYSHYKFTEIMKERFDDKPNHQFAIVSIDIDNFKYINEIYGYEIGSYLLKELAAFIQTVISANAICARSFADNFLFLVERDALEERIEFRIEEDSGFLASLANQLGENYHFSFSIGIYHVKDMSLDVNFMIDCANIARAKGKKQTGTTVYEYTEEMDKIRKENNEIVARMDEAIEKREFVLYYQPKVDLVTGEIVEAEALVRWINEEKFLPPNAFIPLFEKNGFIVQLDYYVIETACIFISEHRSQKLPKISVNLSSVTVLLPNMVDEIMRILERYSVSPKELDLEITETAFVGAFDVEETKIQQLRNIGFTISMDDFGAGISSLNRLKNIEIDTIKIDRGFIIDSLENTKGIGIIKSVISMSKDIDAGTVAEGIETEEQRQLLIEAGCELGQGYLFARPMPEADFLEMVVSEEER